MFSTKYLLRCFAERKNSIRDTVRLWLRAMQFTQMICLLKMLKPTFVLALREGCSMQLTLVAVLTLKLTEEQAAFDVHLATQREGLFRSTVVEVPLARQLVHRWNKIHVYFNRSIQLRQTTLFLHCKCAVQSNKADNPLSIVYVLSNQIKQTTLCLLYIR